MCEKLKKSSARDNFGFFLRKNCLYITDVGKGLFPDFAKKGFYSNSIDDTCHEKAAEKN